MDEDDQEVGGLGEAKEEVKEEPDEDMQPIADVSTLYWTLGIRDYSRL